MTGTSKPPEKDTTQEPSKKRRTDEEGDREIFDSCAHDDFVENSTNTVHNGTDDLTDQVSLTSIASVPVATSSPTEPEVDYASSLEFCSESDYQSSDTESDDSDKMSENEDDSSPQKEPNQPIYRDSGDGPINRDEHIMLTMSYATWHNLNHTQRCDLLELIKMHCPTEAQLARSPNDLISCVAGHLPILQYHDMCDKCFYVFPTEDEDVFNCPTPGCNG